MRKGRKDAKHCVFPNRCGAGVELSGGMRNQKLHAARLCFLLETRQLWRTFGTVLAEVHGAVARNTFRSDNA